MSCSHLPVNIELKDCSVNQLKFIKPTDNQIKKYKNARDFHYRNSIESKIDKVSEIQSKESIRLIL